MGRQLERFFDEEVGSHVVLAELESAALRSPALREAHLHVRRRWRGARRHVEIRLRTRRGR